MLEGKESLEGEERKRGRCGKLRKKRQQEGKRKWKHGNVYPQAIYSKLRYKGAACFDYWIIRQPFQWSADQMKDLSVHSCRKEVMIKRTFKEADAGKLLQCSNGEWFGERKSYVGVCTSSPPSTQYVISYNSWVGGELKAYNHRRYWTCWDTSRPVSDPSHSPPFSSTGDWATWFVLHTALPPKMASFSWCVSALPRVFRCLYDWWPGLYTVCSRWGLMKELYKDNVTIAVLRQWHRHS